MARTMMSGSQGNAIRGYRSAWLVSAGSRWGTSTTLYRLDSPLPTRTPLLRSTAGAEWLPPAGVVRGAPSFELLADGVYGQHNDAEQVTRVQVGPNEHQWDRCPRGSRSEPTRPHLFEKPDQESHQQQVEHLWTWCGRNACRCGAQHDERRGYHWPGRAGLVGQDECCGDQRGEDDD